MSAWLCEVSGYGEKKQTNKTAPVNEPVKEAVFPQVEIVLCEGEVTDEMRYNWNKFWQLLVARAIKESERKRKRSKVKTKTKKSPKVTP